jgi:hypothetical protein
LKPGLTSLHQLSKSSVECQKNEAKVCSCFLSCIFFCSCLEISFCTDCKTRGFCILLSFSLNPSSAPAGAKEAIISMEFLVSLSLNPSSAGAKEAIISIEFCFFCFWSALASTPAQLRLGLRKLFFYGFFLLFALSPIINRIKGGISGQIVKNKS